MGISWDYTQTDKVKEHKGRGDVFLVIKVAKEEIIIFAWLQWFVVHSIAYTLLSAYELVAVLTIDEFMYKEHVCLNRISV